jgi:hypothetical protein
MSESGQCRAGAVDWFQAKTDLGRPPVEAASAVEQRVKAPGDASISRYAFPVMRGDVFADHTANNLMSSLDFPSLMPLTQM